MTDESVTLADGRRLGYREYGDPDGAPLIHNHGGLVCGLDAGWANEIARARGVRLIAPDRPGLVSSDRASSRTTGDWAQDVEQLADHLGIDRFLVAGWSMGGQYALACAALLPDRVIATAVLAGAPPLEDDDTFAELNKMDHRFTLLAQHAPHILEAEFLGMAELARLTPRVFNDLLIRDLAPEGADAARALPGHGLAEVFAPALRTAGGMVDEYLAWVRPWGFGLEDIPGVVQVFRGTEDELVPPAWEAALADAIPNATLFEFAGADHMLPLTRYGEIFDHLMAAEEAAGGSYDGGA